MAYSAELYDVLIKHKSLIIETSRINNERERPVMLFLSTLNARELLIYAISFGYIHVSIKKFGCSNQYIVKMINIPDYIKMTELESEQNFLLSLGYHNIKGTHPSIGYNILRHKLRVEIDNLTGLTDPNGIIMDYLLLSEPDIVCL